MDGDATGMVNVVDYGTDTEGVTLGKAEGMLFLRDNGTDIGINDGWIEGSSTWEGGSWSSTAMLISILMVTTNLQLSKKTPIQIIGLLVLITLLGR